MSLFNLNGSPIRLSYGFFRSQNIVFSLRGAVEIIFSSNLLTKIVFPKKP